MPAPLDDTTFPDDALAYRIVRIRRVQNGGRKIADAKVETPAGTLWVEFVASRSSTEEEFVAPASIIARSGVFR